MELPVRYDTLNARKRKLVREEYIKRQGGLCCYCKRPLTGQPDEKVLEKQVNERLYPEGFFKYPVHLHHNHNTGMTIGAIHCYCNAVLWEYHDE